MALLPIRRILKCFEIKFWIRLEPCNTHWVLLRPNASSWISSLDDNEVANSPEIWLWTRLFCTRELTELADLQPDSSWLVVWPKMFAREAITKSLWNLSFWRISTTRIMVHFELWNLNFVIVLNEFWVKIFDRIRMLVRVKCWNKQFFILNWIELNKTGNGMEVGYRFEQVRLAIRSACYESKLLGVIVLFSVFVVWKLLTTAKQINLFKILCFIVNFVSVMPTMSIGWFKSFESKPIW